MEPCRNYDCTQMFVLIADVKHSREYDVKTRAYVQSVLMDGIDFINKCWSCDYTSLLPDKLWAQGINLGFSGGDSVMCIEYDIESICERIKLLKLMMNSIPMRFAVGAGEWTLRYLDKDINYQDGSAFWMAREMMNYCKDHNRELCFSPCNHSNLEQDTAHKLDLIDKLHSTKELVDMAGFVLSEEAYKKVWANWNAFVKILTYHEGIENVSRYNENNSWR